MSASSGYGGDRGISLPCEALAEDGSRNDGARGDNYRGLALGDLPQMHGRLKSPSSTIANR
jgi:hypothetical protein